MNKENSSIHKLRKGDHEAFASLYRQYHADLYRFAFKYLRSADPTRDAVQHVFVRLWEIRSKLDPERNVRNLLFTIAKNHILNLFRDKRHVFEREAALLENIKDIAVSEEYDDTKEVRSSGLNEAIGKLSARKRQVVSLKIHKGCSNLEVAQTLGISVNTVKVLYSQAVRQMKKEMNDPSG